MKYAVMVPMEDDMLYVIENSTDFELKAKLFDTEQEAIEHAEIWGKHAVVVEYTKESEGE
jgi:NhaP-type Na+/H+ and K+/H+ antiporter